MEKLIEILKNSSADGYKINEIKKETFQTFFVHDKLETVRGGETTDITVTVYKKHDGALGNATFSVYVSSDEKDIKSAVESAIEKALAVSNPPYELVEKEEGKYEGERLILGKDLAETSAEIGKAVFSAKSGDRSTLNATEVFVDKITSRVVNSKGLDKTAVYYKAMIETIPTFNGDGGSVETYSQRKFSAFSKDEMTEYIAKQLREVEAKAVAVKPEGVEKCDITIRGEEIAELLENYAYDLNYSNLYLKSNYFKLGDEVQKGDDCDKLELTLCGTAEGCSGSAYFDEDGSSLKEKKVISEGKVVGFFGSDRFAQYLGEEKTGNLGIVSLKAGDLDKESLSGKTYLECLQFSGLQVDILNDYIGGEVRLAILHKDGKEIPVTAFSISAKLSQAISSIKLSKKTCALPEYTGPEFMLLKDFSVS